MNIIKGKNTCDQSSYNGYAWRRSFAQNPHASHSILHQLQQQTAQKTLYALLGSRAQISRTYI